jgi:uncharacterized protein (DUF427 family)
MFRCANVGSAMTETAPTTVPYGFDQRFDYRVDILPRRNTIIVTLDSVELARTTRSLLIDEQDHGLVFYLPVEDVRMDLLTTTATTSICPYKGTATHWGLAGGDDTSIAWTYNDPRPEVARIAGHIAFYQDTVSLTVGQAPYIGPR